MRSTPIILLLGCSLALGLSPLEGDRVIHDGFCQVDNRNWSTEFAIGAGEKALALYLNVEGIEEFDVVINAVVSKHVSPGATPRTRGRTVDLTECAGMLKRGVNRFEIRSATDAPGFWCRVWVSSHAWLLGALHAHTVHSDGVSTVHDVLKAATSAGASFYALTDHDNLAQCRDTAFRATPGLQPIRGLEWTTDSGHANVLGLEGWAAIDHRSVRELIDDASYRGGLVQVNHPMLPSMEWDRYPAFDAGLDLVEVFNQFNWVRSGNPGHSGDAKAIAWWQELLAHGRPVAAVGSSDYHGRSPRESVLQPCTRVYVPAGDADTVLKYAKLGRAMICAGPGDSRLYLYADTNDNGQWDLVMGEHARVRSGGRTIRFGLEVEGATRQAEVSVWTRAGLYYSQTLGQGGECRYEWSMAVTPLTRDFVRLELRVPRGDDTLSYYEACTNPIYVNYPDYELGPTEFTTAAAAWPDTLYVGQEDTLRLLLRNAGGYSPYRFGLVAACDTALFDITGWQESGPGIGEAARRAEKGYEVVEWCGGYRWGNRLAVGQEYEYWLKVMPKQPGEHPVLFRSWADDRLFVIENDPENGVVGPEDGQFHVEEVPVEVTTGVEERGPVAARTVLEPARPGVVRGWPGLRFTVAATEPVLALVVRDAAGREVGRFDGAGFGPGRHAQVPLAAGGRPAPGVYFASLVTAVRTQTVRFTVVR